MKSFYSIISISPNTSSMDAISIGLILQNGEKLEFGLSQRKQNIVKHFDEFNDAFLAKLLSNMEQFYKQPKSISSQNGLFDDHFSTDTVSQFQYLHNYSNGLIRFSEPKEILSVTESTFKDLFTLLIDSKVEQAVVKSTDVKLHFQTKIKENLIDRVADRIFTNKEVSPSVIPTLNSPFSIDCIGLNGNLVGAKSVFFGSNVPTIQKDINTLVSVLYHLQTRLQKKPSPHFYLIADEPSEHRSSQHKYWERMQKDSLLQLRNSDQLEDVVRVVYETEAGRFKL